MTLADAEPMGNALPERVPMAKLTAEMPVEESSMGLEYVEKDDAVAPSDAM